MTDTPPADRKAADCKAAAPARAGWRAGWRRFVPLALVLLLAAGLRLHGIGFGLPSLNDPDEPLFMMTAFEMLKHRTLNPGWFGHPATTTFYALALVLLGVAGFAIGSGRYADIKAFGDAAYADPGIAFLPARVLMAGFGVICVLLVHRLGRRLGADTPGGDKLGLIAALLLAVNAIHIEYSQIIRTDVQASMFMLLGALAALAIVRDGRRRDYVLAGVFAGLACATKWPAALILLNALGAGLWRWRQGRRDWRMVGLTGLAAAATLIMVSPYLVLDWPALLRNLAGEARPVHPGATGGGFLFNLGWYLDHTLIASLGLAGTMLAGLGAVTLARGAPRDAAALLPAPAVLLAVICGQSLLWERWIVPLLPFAALLAAHAMVTLADGLRARLGAGRGRAMMRWLGPLALLALLAPMLRAEFVRARERAHDTRQIAAAWVRGHVPPGSTILVEHAAFDLLQGPWTLRFPLGALGCVDPRAALSGQIGYSKVETARHGSPLVDLGHVDRDRLDSCRADYALFSNYGRYRNRPGVFAAELERYDTLRGAAPFVAVIRPVAGESSGPVIYIARLR